MLKISSRITIPTHEFEWQTTRAQGAGGQHVNKNDTAVQLIFNIQTSSLPDFYKQRLLASKDCHITTGGKIIIKAQDSRSQYQNKALALERLREIIIEAVKVQKKRRATRPTRASQTRRMDQKSRHGDKKANRRKPEF